MGATTPFPTPDAIARAELLTRERFVYEGETLQEALAPGSARRRALDAAVAEVDAGFKQPSIAWRRSFSLLLGLERVLSQDEPHLVDGTVLSAHQVDALSGTLTALLAEAQRSGNGATVANGTATPSGNGAAASNRGATANGGPKNGAAKTGAAPPTPAAKHDGAAAAAAGAASRAAKPTSDGADADLELEDVDADEDDDLIDDELGDDPDAAEDEEIAEDEEPQDWQDEDEQEEGQLEEQPEDPNAAKRFWFEHATGAGKTVAALGFVEASRTGGVLILTHRRNLVDQFHGELRDRGYRDRISGALLDGHDAANGPVTVETYQWFVRNAGRISDAYTIVICDEAHTALGEKTSAAIRRWAGPVFVGMTATGALIARHVTDLFPTQTSRFDLAQAARRGVIAPLRCIRIPPGPGVRTIAKVPLRRGEVDTEFDQEMLAQILDQTPFNVAIADLYKTRFNGVPGVVYAAGVRHAYNVAQSFRDAGMNAQGVSGETPKRQLARILADYESGKIDVLVNAQLLAEGWNSPRATICMHLAPTASKRIYQQRVGRVTRRHPGKEAGIVIDFVHPATKHDDPVVTLHSLLDRDVYRGGAIVVGPVRRGRGRRVRVERRVLPVTPDPERRAEVFERELWRIAVENLDYGEQHVWAALAGARVAPNGWRRAKAMLHFDRGGELKRRFLLTAVQRNRNPQLRLRALQEIAASRDAEAFDTAIDIMAGWPRDERREGVKIMLQALAERRIGRRDQANAWIWRMAEYTREVHEEYAVQRWPETKRLLGLLVNSSGAAHARNARRLVHASRKEDRRLSAALLAAALAHTPEAEEALRGARTRMARKPAALARELLRNFPKGRRGTKRRRRRPGSGAAGDGSAGADGTVATATLDEEDAGDLELTEAEAAVDDDDLDDDSDDGVMQTAADDSRNDSKDSADDDSNDDPDDDWGNDSDSNESADDDSDDDSGNDSDDDSEDNAEDDSEDKAQDRAGDNADYEANAQDRAGDNADYEANAQDRADDNADYEANAQDRADDNADYEANTPANTRGDNAATAQGDNAATAQHDEAKIEPAPARPRRRRQPANDVAATTQHDEAKTEPAPPRPRRRRKPANDVAATAQHDEAKTEPAPPRPRRRRKPASEDDAAAAA
jgi:ribonuclease E